MTFWGCWHASMTSGSIGHTWRDPCGTWWGLVGALGGLGSRAWRRVMPRDFAWFSVIFRDFSISIYFSLLKIGSFVGTGCRRVILRDFPWRTVTAWKWPWWAMNGTFLGWMTLDIYKYWLWKSLKNDVTVKSQTCGPVQYSHQLWDASTQPFELRWLGIIRSYVPHWQTWFVSRI